MLIFTNGRAYLDGRWTTGMDILVDNGKIADIKPQGTQYEGIVADVKGGYITPGFIDIHIHGSNGSDVMDAKPEALENISCFLAGKGTTSWLATTMTVSIEEIRRSLQVTADYMKDTSRRGAQVLGIHLEGPFLSPKAKGAHAEEYILSPTVDNYLAITGGMPDIVRMVTIAPEEEGALELIKYLKERSITPSLGHTKGTYDQCKKALESGMTHACHFYNAMTPLNHREPGAVGAILENDSAAIELIADLVHVHPVALKLAVNVKGPGKTVLITDAMVAAGLKDGDYELGGLPVYVRNGEARQANGTLAGSTLTLDRALRNMIKIGVPSEDVIAMLTETPAREIGADHFKGRLAKGFDADINILDDDFNVKETYIRGKKFKA
ncbi:MAG TPA: N-acetylglucosamine-6-phosphate deacetylase [Clostridiales bacterium]|nr:N-acetylglucosamine-6-phosphate deacetylase [Clostridiales bacterium]